MKIVAISNSGEFLPVIWRLRREGVDASIYVHNPQYRGNYNGILSKVTLQGLKSALKKADIVIFDMSRPNERTKFDAALLKTFGIKFSSPSVFGPVADKLRKDVKVIGMSALTEELELDRHKGAEVAEKMGFTLPETKQFKTLTQGAQFLKGRKDMWVFKPENNQDLDLTYVEKFPGELLTKMLDEYTTRIGDKCDYILQRKIDGAEVSSEVFIGETGLRHFNQTIESKKLMAGGLGMSIGSQSNTVFITDSKGPSDPLTKMAAYLHKEGYIGPCDANCIIRGGIHYFLEWTPRFGWDALYCLLTLIKGKLSDFFLKDFDVQFHNGYAASQRISIAPYPYGTASLRKMYAKDVSIMGKLKDYPQFWAQDVYSDTGKLKCAGADGIIGVVAARGENLGAAWGRVYHSIGKLKICSDMQYRKDGLAEAQKRIGRLKVA